ncbi:uncharacterized protein LOC5510487 [Nematostella vectensis]|uniref:uncharacterized protein LOC5510487 n=1 Tax=Nematostella vectensis TaxID=45351 RepID=UPI0013900B0E|nr:uncharacterized protein LOC5510487 [Nematostella vectensis]
MKGQQCCTSICQHPECWKSDLKRVKEAVYRRNGVEGESFNTEPSKQLDQVYLTKEQRLESIDGSLPTLKIVDVFGGLDMGTSNKQLPRPHRRSTSLPSLSPDSSRDSDYQSRAQSTVRAPHPSPSACPSAMTDYKRRMLWKKQVASRQSSAKSEGCQPNKVAHIGVHEVYDDNELNQEWQEVYITSAYLVWCPSNKKKRKRRSSSRSSSGGSVRKGPKKIVPKDVTEDLVPAAMEPFKPSRPKSTKTPTGGQPYSPYRPPAKMVNVETLELDKYGMEDLADLPRPVLSGILRQLNARNISQTDVTAEVSEPKDQSIPRKHVKIVESDADLIQAVELVTSESTVAMAIEENNSRVKLAVDINSSLTPPVEDKTLVIEIGEERENNGKKQLVLVEKEGEGQVTARGARHALHMHNIGIPMEGKPKHVVHHCSSSIPRRLAQLGVAMEPVELVPVTPSPTSTPREELTVAVSRTEEPCPRTPLNVTIPSGGLALIDSYYESDDMSREFSAYRFSPSPVRAPAPTPISPDKSYDHFRQYSRTSQSHDRLKYSSGSYGRSSAQDDDSSKQMRRWETLSSVYDAEESMGEGREIAAGKELIIQEEDRSVELSESVFLTEGPLEEPCDTPRQSNSDWAQEKMIVNLIEPSIRGRSPSPGSRTHIPRDIIDQFQGDLYGRKRHKHHPSMPANSPTRVPIAKETKGIIIGTGISIPGWRQPRTRTPLQFMETPGRYAPKPLRQPPSNSIPKSIKIFHLAPPERPRPKSTPPRMPSAEKNNFVAEVLSESSLHSNSQEQASVPTSMGVNEASSASRSGSVPPPPSPEVPNIGEPTVGGLEPLREEDERSCIAAYDGTGNEGVMQRLAPVGAEWEEDSVDLSNEKEGLANNLDLNDISNELSHLKDDLPNDPDSKVLSTSGDHSIKNSDPDKNEVSREENVALSKQVNADKQVIADDAFGEQVIAKNGTGEQVIAEDGTGEQVIAEDGTCEQVMAKDGSTSFRENNQITEGTVTEDANHSEDNNFPTVTLVDSNAEQNVEKTESLGEEQQGGATDAVLQKIGLDEAEKPKEDKNEDKESRGSPSPPPGSPEVESNPDFTEGLDLNLDLEAELKAAMEGLDGFSVDDDDGYADCVGGPLSARPTSPEAL